MTRVIGSVLSGFHRSRFDSLAVAYDLLAFDMARLMPNQFVDSRDHRAAVGKIGFDFYDTGIDGRSVRA